MSSWRKYFTVVNSQDRFIQNYEKMTADGGASSSGSTAAKYASYLPEVYSGAPNRVERYVQYEQMDLDSEVSRALDTISDFSTQNYSIDDEPFTVVYKGQMSETEIKLIKETMSQWCSINRWQQRLWRTFRNMLKYGDQVYIRDPETFKMIWIDPVKVVKIMVNENKGKTIEQYMIQDLDLNLMSLVGTNMLIHDQFSFPGGYPRSSNPGAGAGTINYGAGSSNRSPGSRNSRFIQSSTGQAVDAAHVVHFSLSEGLDSQWPFGTSILESIYKVYKQKDLLEDAIIIYRIVRAPERRAFYIDVGSLSGARAMQYVERIKNEIYQRRIPNKTGGGQNAIDASYNPIGINDDYFLATNAEGKGTKIETLGGGENLGVIDDLKYFNNKMIRGLGIPSSYLPTGPDDGTTAYSDGKVGTAYVQEFRFSKYCQRLQNLASPIFDREFKMFLKNRGIEIDSSLFELQMWPPQSLSEYRQLQLDGERINVFTSIMNSDAGKYISKRFALSKYLGLTEDEILENEMMWKQENPSKVSTTNKRPSMSDNGLGLTSVGVRPSFDESGAAEPNAGEEPTPTEVPPEATTTPGPGSDDLQNSATDGTGLESV